MCVCVRVQIRYLSEQVDWQVSVSKECHKPVTLVDVLSCVAWNNVEHVNIFLNNCNQDIITIKYCIFTA